MNPIEKWYAVYTKPRWEKKVSEQLMRKKIEAYCPLNKVLRQWHDRKKLIEEPLFTSYVFVRASQLRHTPILETNGIINFVHWLGKPAVIRNEEINAIKQFLFDFTNVQLEKSRVSLNDKVRIVHGPLLNMEGNVVEVLNQTVKVILPSLGYSMTATIDKRHVEKLYSYSDQFVQPYKMIS